MQSKMVQFLDSKIINKSFYMYFIISINLVLTILNEKHTLNFITVILLTSEVLLTR
jgi:hypothetical protein